MKLQPNFTQDDTARNAALGLLTIQAVFFMLIVILSLVGLGPLALIFSAVALLVLLGATARAILGGEALEVENWKGFCLIAFD